MPNNKTKSSKNDEILPFLVNKTINYACLNFYLMALFF